MMVSNIDLRSLESIAVEFFINPTGQHQLYCVECDNDGRGLKRLKDIPQTFAGSQSGWELLMSGADELVIVGAGYYDKVYDRGNIMPESRANRRIVYSRVPDKD